jgi:hypothetical protein
MKKFLSIAIICLAAHVASAQTTFGIKAGGNMSFLKYKVESESQKYTWDGSRVGFQVGGVAQIGIAENFAVQTELLFLMKGAKDLVPEGLEDVKINTQTFAIDLPITFIYRANGFFGGFGPNLSYGVSSKLKVDGSDTEYDLYSTKNEAVFFSQKRFEAGANILAGYKLRSGLAFSLNYVQGLTNASNANKEVDEQDAKIKMHSSYLGLSIGYFFGK